jgi:hypothetical protein
LHRDEGLAVVTATLDEDAIVAAGRGPTKQQAKRLAALCFLQLLGCPLEADAGMSCPVM